MLDIPDDFILNKILLVEVLGLSKTVFLIIILKNDGTFFYPCFIDLFLINKQGTIEELFPSNTLSFVDSQHLLDCLVDFFDLDHVLLSALLFLTLAEL